MIDGVNLITTETICISGSFIGNLIPAIITAIGCITLIVLLVFCIKDKEMPTFVARRPLIQDMKKDIWYN